jgi:hypothetical protein
MIGSGKLFRPALAGVLLCLLWPACSYLGPRKNIGGPFVIDEGVRFRFYAPTARYVQLAGDWPENNWARGDGRSGESNVGLMEDPDGDGLWEIVVPLPPGRYRYLFRLDENTWHLDPGNPEEVRGGPAGRCSQLVLVPRNNKVEIR